MMDQELMCPIFVYYAKDLQHQKFKSVLKKLQKDFEES